MPAARAGDHHETGFGDFAPELLGLLIFHFGRLRARRTEDRHFPRAGVGREQFESVTQFPQRRLDHPHITAVLDIRQHLQRAFDNVGDAFLVETSALVIDEFLDAPLQFRVHRRFLCFYHAGEITGRRKKCNCRFSCSGHKKAQESAKRIHEGGSRENGTQLINAVGWNRNFNHG